MFVTIWCLTPLQSLLADPGKDRGCSTSTSVIHSFIHSVIHWWFGKISLRRRHALMVGDGHKIDYVNIFRRFQILKGLHIALLVPKLPRFCLMGGFWLLVELQRWRVCVCSLRRPIIYHTIYWKYSGVPPTRSINFFTNFFSSLQFLILSIGLPRRQLPPKISARRRNRLPIKNLTAHYNSQFCASIHFCFAQ